MSKIFLVVILTRVSNQVSNLFLSTPISEVSIIDRHDVDLFYAFSSDFCSPPVNLGCFNTSTANPYLFIAFQVHEFSKYLVVWFQIEESDVLKRLVKYSCMSNDVFVLGKTFQSSYYVVNYILFLNNSFKDMSMHIKISILNYLHMYIKLKYFFNDRIVSMN